MTTKHHLRAASKPKSYDEEAHTIEVEVSTENPVHGVSLSHKRGAVDLSRFIGAPFLNAHKRGDVRDVLGKIVAARIEERTLIATVKLTRRADAAGIVQDIIDGMIPQTSVGFTVSEWGQDSVDPKSGARTRTATRWRPFEVSAVPYAADETRVRSDNATSGAQPRSNPMKSKKAGAGAAPEDNAPDVLDEPANENTVAQTRAAIRDVFKRVFPRDLERAYREADAILDDGGDIADANARAQQILEERTERTPRLRVTNPGPSPEETLHARAGGFAMRYLGVPTKDERAIHFAGFTVEDQARDWLDAAGVRTRGMNREALLTTAFQTRAGQHTTSDFPLMLDIGLSTAVRAAYEAAASPLVALCFKDTAPDFRAQYRHQLGELPKLSKVGESGEIKSVTRGEARESWSLDTYGAIFSASRKLIVNDAFNQLGDFARDAGQAAAQTVADLVVTALTQSDGEGPVMGDGDRLFDATGSHGNFSGLAAFSDIDVDSVSDARKAMLLQTGVDGVTIINVRPDTIIVPPSRLTEAEQFVAAYQAQAFTETNPFSNKLTVVCEPRLQAISAFRWYLADSRHPALVLGGLAGNEGPQVSARDGWEVLGREWRVTLDVGVGPRDWRGWYLNAGEDSNSAGG